MLQIACIVTCFFAIGYGGSIEEVNHDRTEHEHLLLTCPVSEEEFVIWYRKDGNKDKEIQFSDRYFFPDLDSLKISNVKLSDAGIYKCKTPLDGKTIKSFKINVLDLSDKKKKDEAPKWILLPNPIKRIDAGRVAVMPCKASGKDVVVKAYKLKSNNQIMRQLPQTGLVLHRPKASDSGKYSCVAENAVGKLTHIFEVIVRVHGGLSDWSEWGRCDEECGYGVQTRSRTCDKPAPANGGRRCADDLTMSQRCRERSCSVPRLTKFGFDLTDGGNLKLHCHAKGIPAPTTEWKRDGVKFSTLFGIDSKPTVIIPKSKARTGQYRCTIRNRAGYFTMYISIEV